MKKLLATLVIVSVVLLAACSSNGGGGIHPAVAPPGGTATEQELCADLRAKAPDTTISSDANAVSNDMAVGAGLLGLEADAYLNSVGGYGLKSVQWERKKMLHLCASGQF